MYQTRNDRIKARLEAEGLDALLVTSLPNIQYLSGFTGSTAMVLVTRENCWFLTDFRYHERVAQEVWDGYTMVDNTGKKLTEEVIPSLADGAALKKLGFESDHVTHATYTKLAEAEDREFVPTTGWVMDLRIVKDEHEIELIRKSVLLNEKIFTELLPLIGPDITEAELAAEIGYRAVRYGAEGISFDPIIASGPNSSKPHAGFTTSKLVPGTPLTFDMGVRLNGYCSDMTRTVFYKDCPPEWEEVYNLVRRAKDAAHAAIKPGLMGKDIDAVARDLIYGAGYEGKFEHGLGHGVGIEVHEMPRLARPSETVLAPGQVATNEPGIYLPGNGGIRIEDIFVVTADGAENLNTLNTDIQVLG